MTVFNMQQNDFSVLGVTGEIDCFLKYCILWHCFLLIQKDKIKIKLWSQFHFITSSQNCSLKHKDKKCDDIMTMLAREETNKQTVIQSNSFQNNKNKRTNSHGVQVNCIPLSANVFWGLIGFKVLLRCEACNKEPGRWMNPHLGTGCNKLWFISWQKWKNSQSILLTRKKKKKGGTAVTDGAST